MQNAVKGTNIGDFQSAFLICSKRRKPIIGQQIIKILPIIKRVKLGRIIRYRIIMQSILIAALLLMIVAKLFITERATLR